MKSVWGLVAMVSFSCGGQTPPAAPDATKTPAMAADAAPDPTPTRPNPPAPTLAPAPSPRPPPTWTALDLSAPVARTEDGLAVMTVVSENVGDDARVRFIDEAWTTLEWPQIEASDGARVYAAVAKAGSQHSDVVIRDGRVYTNVIAALAGRETHPGGCVAARNGQLALGIPAAAKDGLPAGFAAGRAVFVGADGATRTFEGGRFDDTCWKSWMDPDGAFVMDEDLTRQPVDGTPPAPVLQTRAMPMSVEMRSTRGPALCITGACARGMKNDDRATQLAALANQPGCRRRVVKLFGRWAVGLCLKDTVTLRRTDLEKVDAGTPFWDATETLETKKKAPTPLIAVADNGDVVVGFDYRWKRYGVWKVGAKTLNPVRALGPGELLAGTNPPLLIQGLAPRVPESTTGATLMGRTLAYGAGGSTTMWRSLGGGSKAAFDAALARAAAVLPGDPALRMAGEAVVNLNCGAYVRSPVGHEGVSVSDWTPPVLPALHAKAVHHPPECLPLRSVTALPGLTDVLLAVTATGELALTSLPKPLPLPQGTGRGPRPATGRDTPPAPVVQNPVPGPPWTVFPGTQIASITGYGGAPSPGEGTRNPGKATWQYAGAAIIRLVGVDDHVIVLGHQGAATVPANATPMAALQYSAGFFAAIDDALIACGTQGVCRRFDLAVGSAIDAVVPRTERALVLGFADGREGVFNVPARGGFALPVETLAGKLYADLVAKRKAIFQP